MKYISGKILKENGFVNGYIGFEKNKILEQRQGKSPVKPICKGLILPSFINFHTHIGDSFISQRKIKLPKDIEKLVSPPDGLKHRLLKKASEKEVIEGMKKTIGFMMRTGTNLFCDFRENGILGLSKIKKALKPFDISSITLSRPEKIEYKKNEIEKLLEESDGIGLSSITDWDYSSVKKIVQETKRKQKIFALHASERIREDIDLILDLKPNFLIHMTKATEPDFKKVKESNIPIVICPRSNSFFGIKPNYKLLKKTGVEILIGTDNCMISTPNIIEEIKFIRRQTNIFSLEELLNMISISPRKVLNLSPCIPCQNSPADFVVLDPKSLDILYKKVGFIERGMIDES